MRGFVEIAAKYSVLLFLPVESVVVRAKIVLLFKDSWTLKPIDHMTFYDKFSLNYLNSDYISIMTVLCQFNKRREKSRVEIVQKKS